MDLNNIDDKRAEQYRKLAYAAFFLSLGVMLFVFVPAMYWGSAIGVVASLLLAAALFAIAFVAGGLGWSRLESKHPVEPPYYSAEERLDPSSGAETTPSEAPVASENGQEPFGPPGPSDEGRPPL